MKLPDGWEMHHLGELFSSRKEKGIEGLPTLSVTINDGLVDRSSIERKTDTNLSPQEHLLIRKDDLAYNMMRMWQGAFGLADYDGLVSPAYVVLSPTNHINSKFAFYWFKSPRMIYLFWAYSYGLTGDRLRLYFNDFTKIKHILPPISEQKAIADLLSTWDEAIEKTERLIQAKEKRFKWLLHELIAKPCLSGKWNITTLGELGVITSAGVDKKIIDGEQPVRLLNYLNIYQNNFITSANLDHWVTAPDLKIKNCDVKKGDIFFTPSSEVREDIGHSAVVVEDIDDAVYSYHVVRLRVNKSLDLTYSAYAFKSNHFYSQAYKYCDGSGQRYVISQANFRRIEVCIPSLEEQKQIGAVLSDSEKEINLLKSLAEKYKTQKRGLMQKMLTGEWRVKEEIIKQYSEA